MTAIGTTLTEEADNIIKMLTDVVNKFAAVFDGRTNVVVAIGELLGDAFWTLFDAINIIIVNAAGVVPKIVTELWTVLTSPIKLLVISTLWGLFLGDTPFTIHHSQRLDDHSRVGTKYIRRHDIWQDAI
jgi:hypothetical protein